MTAAARLSVICTAVLLGCGPVPGSVADTPKGAPFAVLSLPSPSEVEAPQQFEQRLRRELSAFAAQNNMRFADDSDEHKRIENRDPLVWLSAYETRVLVLVDWNTRSYRPNIIAIIGNEKEERPRQIHAALIQHLKRAEIPFKVEQSPHRSSDG